MSPPEKYEPLSINPQRDSRAATAILRLQKWYKKESGLWETTGWWNAANVLTMLADFSAVDDSLDGVIHEVFKNTFDQAQLHGFSGFLNEYYDDEGWWALAWLKIYDLTKEERYIQMAISIFEDMKAGWGGPCGGLWWNKKQTYTGAIENELFLTVAAQLANRAANEEYYIQWALKQWEWFQQTSMINSDHNINNGINAVTCRNGGGTVWTYNQGVILGGLVELNKAAPDHSYLETATEIAIAAIKKLTDSDGILHEPGEPNCGADGPQFKGIFVRNLRILHQAKPDDRFKTFIHKNAESIWGKDRGPDDELGLVWSGPYNSATAATHSSACDALVAALSITEPAARLVPKEN